MALPEPQRNADDGGGILPAGLALYAKWMLPCSFFAYTAVTPETGCQAPQGKVSTLTAPDGQAPKSRMKTTAPVHRGGLVRESGSLPPYSAAWNPSPGSYSMVLRCSQRRTTSWSGMVNVRMRLWSPSNSHTKDSSSRKNRYSVSVATPS